MPASGGATALNETRAEVVPQLNRDSDSSPAAAPSVLAGHAAALLCAVIWSANFMLIKYARAEVSATTLCVLRYTFALGAVLPVWLWRRPNLRAITRKQWLVLALLAVLVHPLYQLLLMFGIKGTGSGLVGLLVATQSLHLSWLAPLILSERMTGRDGLALLLGGIGVTLPLLGLNDWSMQSLIYPLAILAAGALAGLNTTIPRRMRHHLPPTDLMLVVMTLAIGLTMFMATPTTVRAAVNASGKTQLIALWLGTGGMVLAQALWYRAARAVPAGALAVYFFVMMSLSTLWGVLLMDERFTWREGSGMAMVVVALLINSPHGRGGNGNPQTT